MENIALADSYLITGIYFLILVIVLAININLWRKAKLSIGYLILLIVLVILPVYSKYKSNTDKRDAAKKFLGYYKLDMLDQQKCDSCSLLLDSSYHYTLLIKGKKAGTYTWDIEYVSSCPCYTLLLEHGPSFVISYSDRQIDDINRK